MSRAGGVEARPPAENYYHQIVGIVIIVSLYDQIVGEYVFMIR